ncbi:hypothetical protein Nhal_3380 [Nitrosococcus halophilus Nc 4]|uniref:Uncharacterized protein n=1 Tax=Nitrosococcus halophilus (strain Nc4) TaxID=472759 RepID=D5C0T9_NITHN|nr:hypothetical protein Nhal_3380 [Nitrosococcus halophilus Nc 4]
MGVSGGLKWEKETLAGGYRPILRKVFSALWGEVGGGCLGVVSLGQGKMSHKLCDTFRGTFHHPRASRGVFLFHRLKGQGAEGGFPEAFAKLTETL